MKAAVNTRHGPPNVVVHITDVEKPAPKDNEILIRVRAAGINPLDWRLMQGGPYIVRMLLGLGKPKIKRPGVDVSGQVETVGRNVVHFKPGDAVFGMCKGTFAEYVCASESAFVIKPGNISFEQAASVPVAALTALQGLRDKGKIQPGQKVLIKVRPEASVPSPCRSPSRSAQRLLPYAAPEMWTWSDLSERITSLITPRKISRKRINAMTLFSTTLATIRCRHAEAS